MSTPLERLKKIKGEAIQKLIEDGLLSSTRIYIGMSTCEIAAGSKELWDIFQNEIKGKGIKDVLLKQKGCAGRCNLEPTVEILQTGKTPFKYTNVDAEKAKELIKKHLIENNVPSGERSKEMRTDPFMLTDRSMFVFGDLTSFKKQLRMTLRNCGIIDPENIKDYLAVRGYEALARVLTEYSPERVIEEVTKSGLRGRGGGGFPTGVKWKNVAGEKSNEKYVICNADEGDPGAFMDRSALEGDPHIVIEGMAIAAYAVGAKKGFIYIRAEYPLAVERLRKAIRDARVFGFLGEKILGKEFSFDIEIVLGAGAFVCGEETALIYSIEGARGMPRARPPYPSVRGLWGKPTLINNVETFANIAVIVLDGYKYFASIGTEKSKGTKVFALAGKVNNSGLIEVPMGITLREIIYDIGGGIKDEKKFKAVLTGGPSGGCLKDTHLDAIVDYDSLKTAGSMMGSGGMIVLNEDDCMVDIAKYFLSFTQNESCGKCTPCREGTKRMLEILTRITSGKGKEEDIEKLERLANVIKKASLCGLGQTAPNPVLTTLRYFRDEYEAHIKYKRCPAVVCKGIISSACQHICPLGQDVPSYIGLILQKRFDEAIEIVRKENPLPLICGRVCHHPCEDKCRRGDIDKAINIRALKRFLADYELKRGIGIKAEPKKGKDEQIAVIGSGPAGLTCAYYLAQEGYRVTIFEQLPVAGGMLAVGIPEYRLPKDILKVEIGQIEKLGVEIKLNTTVGKDIQLSRLKREYKAVFIATGAHKSLKLGIPGEDLAGVIDAVEFLRNINLGRKVELGERVIIIGGGNAAIDAARVAKRIGKKVQIFYRRTKKEMPAQDEEVEQATLEGIAIQFLTAPVKVLSSNGRIKGIECIRMELCDIDKSGRRRPVPIKGSEFTVELDTLILAISQEPDLSLLGGNSVALKVSKWNTIEVNPQTLYTTEEGVFAGGDVVLGPKTVTEAMAQGKLAAQMINKYIQGEELERRYEVTRPALQVEAIELTEEEIEELRRPEMAALPFSERVEGFKEVELGFSEPQAISEVKHCLRCDMERE